MKRLFLSGLLVVLGGFSYAQAQLVPNLTSAELALHRLEKLVTLKKVDPEYQANFKHLVLTRLSPTKPNDPAYELVLLQSEGNDGLSDMVEIQQDKNGKALSHKAMVHTADPNLIAWPHKDPVTLSEIALHWIEDDYNPGDNSKDVITEYLSELIVTQETDQTGQIIAKFSLKNSQNTDVLILKFTTDGKFISYELKI